MDLALLRINFKSFFRLYVYASLHVVNEKDKFLITLAENKKLFTIFGELCTCPPPVEQGQPFATMGVDVVKSSAVLLSTFVLG
jgi:hypothetical protein